MQNIPFIRIKKTGIGNRTAIRGLVCIIRGLDCTIRALVFVIRTLNLSFARRKGKLRKVCYIVSSECYNFESLLQRKFVLLQQIFFERLTPDETMRKQLWMTMLCCLLCGWQMGWPTSVELGRRYAVHRSETATEVADGGEACGIAHFGDGQFAFAQKFGSMAQANGADEFSGLLPCK